MAAVNAGRIAQRVLPGQQAAQAPVSNAPPGTFAPGTKVQVGSVRVVIERYLSEGGFAHVYVVRVPKEGSKYETAVLKRVAVPDKEALANMRTEVETMKKLQGHTHIVRYIDSHASQLKTGGYEVFLLMEFCGGGGLIDFMNTRLQYRLTEPEILHIFSDTAEGVATMHYLKPPLLHRDLKVENILISKPSSSSTNVLYKLCDFGSTAPPRPAASNAAEARLIEDDVQRHTTMQYRSPEMIDVWRKQPIDEKSDIWALGVLLYKLCYYTTPFEEVGQMAILNAKFKFPHHPHFTERLRRLISAMLKEDPKQRPNIYQVISEVCNMRGKIVSIKDIYSNRSRSEDVKNRQLPPTSPQVTSPPPAAVGISRAAPAKTEEAIPDIVPMRRGRPTAPSQKPPATKPSPSPAKGDPFAALDSSNYNVRAAKVDELSQKFPSLEEFSIASDKKPDFNFGADSKPPAAEKARAIGSVVADRARAGVPPSSTTAAGVRTSDNRNLPKTASSKPINASSASSPQQPVPQQAAPRSNYVSTGTMTSSFTTPLSPPKIDYSLSSKPIWRVPNHTRSESQPRPASGNADTARTSVGTARSLQPSPRPEAQQSRSPLPSHGPPIESKDSFGNDSSGVSRTKSVNAASRPGSSGFARSNIDYLRDREENMSRSPPALGSRRSSRQQLSGLGSPEDSAPIKNDTAYLRSLEDHEDAWEQEQVKTASMRAKRASMPAVKLSEGSTRFFQRDDSADESAAPQRPRDRSRGKSAYASERPLSPVAASEATSGSPRPTLIDTSGLDEIEDMPADTRRELERQQALQEERRVAAAAEAYRSRAGGAQPAPSRASTIQARMQSLMDEGRQSPVKRTAAGYGHYTDVPEGNDVPVRKPLPETAKIISPASTVRSPEAVISPRAQQDLISPKQRESTARSLAQQIPVSASAPPTSSAQSSSLPTTTAPASRTDKTLPPRPTAKPKPNTLRSGFTGSRSPLPASPISAREEGQPASLAASQGQGSRLAALIAKDQEGQALPGCGNKARDDGLASGKEASAAREEMNGSDDIDLGPEAGPGGGKDWEADFSRRYPSLSGIELVETEIGGGERRAVRVRDV